MSLFGQVFSTGTVTKPQNIQNTAVGRNNDGSAVLSSLSNGQTISGKISSVSGSNVSIDLGGGTMINAKLDSSMALSEGQTVTFEVRSNGNDQISLSPLYTNVAQGITAENALSSAGMAVNSDTLSMTLAMMNSGMGIDRESLGDMYHAINSFPGENITNLVEMKSLGIPLNPENVEQYGAFKNYENSISEGLRDIAENAIKLYDELNASGDGDKAISFMRQFTDIISGDGLSTIQSAAQQSSEISESGKESGGKIIITENGEISATENIAGKAEAVIKDAASEVMELTDAKVQEGVLQEKLNVQSGNAVPNDPMGSLITELREFADKTEIPEQSVINQDETEPAEKTKYMSDDTQTAADTPAARLKDRMINLLKDNNAPESLIRSFEKMTPDDTGMMKAAGEFLKMLDENAPALKQGFLKSDIKRMLASDDFKQTAVNAMKQSLSLAPEEVADKSNVRELYQKIDMQVKNLTGMLSNIAHPESSMMQSLGQMNQSMDFMNQMNQAMQYVQIPLKMAGGEATGDLFVYTDRKSLAAKDGNISALLHLDMRYLGPLDVYASINSANHVNTKFYLESDEMIDFIAEHIDMLTKRLEERGYHTSADMVTRDKLKSGGGGERPVKDPENTTVISKQRFDMRA
ncbi:MAG: hypothetical protein K6C99_01560 [Lachnospiraceae bacterium]|nr:hypothetical protein [Lachnospiraceae bacterium]